MWFRLATWGLGHGRHRSYVLLAASLAFGVAAPSWVAGPAFAITLEDALRGLIERHPLIKAGQRSIESAEGTIGIANSRYLPQVGLTGDAGYSNVDSPLRRQLGQGPAEDDRRKITFSVTQNILDGFAKQSAYRQAEFNRDAITSGLTTTRQGVLFEGASAYLNVLRENRLVDLAMENERTIQQQLNLEDERVRRGSGIAVDILLAKARLQIARERRVAFEGTRLDAMSRYRQVFDAPPEVGAMRDPELPLAILPQSLETAVNAAVSNNPSIERASRLVQVSEQRTRGAASGYWPKLDLVGRANRETNVDGIAGTRKDYSVLLQVTWDLFSGFATRSAVSEAVGELGAQRENELQTRNKVAEEVRLAWQAYQTARRREELLTNAVDIASEVFEARKSLRDSGRETAINVLDAENEVYAARINLVAATYDAHVAIYRVLAAIGSLEVERIVPRR
jgi:outer membrane protein, adhesin transport system